MLPYEERILVDIYKDEELDLFGVFKKRRLAKEQKERSKIRILQKERAEKDTIQFYKTMTKELIDIYGKEGAIRYLKVLFKIPEHHDIGKE